MAQGLRVILFNAQEEYSPELRAAVLRFAGTKIVAEVDDAALLAPTVQQIPAQVLFVNLDPEPAVLLPLAGEIASSNPGLAVFAVTESTDRQLILDAMRQGLKEFLAKPIDARMLGTALQRVADRLTTGGPQGRLITVIGAAGGVGATVLATNLACELVSFASRGVCLVDLDYRFGQVGTLLDLEPTYSIADLCETPERLEHQVIEKALVRHSSGVHVLCRPPTTAQADTITAAACVGALSGLVSMFEYVVVDGPSRYDLGAKAVLDISDCILLTLELLVPDVRNIQRMLDSMKQVGFNLERLRLVCNRLGRDSASLSVSDVEATLGLDVYASIPDDWLTVCASVNLGEPLVKKHQRSRVRQSILDLAQRLHKNGEETSDGNDSRKGGPLTKIFSDA
jgi:pilus assembly protein CpaE